MTRKDYQIIANGIHLSLRDPQTGIVLPERERAAAALVAQSIATELEHDNPRFDRAKFLRACGF